MYKNLYKTMITFKYYLTSLMLKYQRLLPINIMGIKRNYVGYFFITDKN